MIPIPIILRHLIFRVPRKDHNFDNHPHRLGAAAMKALHAGLDPKQSFRRAIQGYSCYPNLQPSNLKSQTLRVRVEGLGLRFIGLRFRVRGFKVKGLRLKF